jgi:uncharacterized heparinase superfamily protein
LHSSQGGYQRIACGQTLVLIDAAAPPAGATSLTAHAGALSFELSAGTERIIVNGGTSQIKGPEWVQAMRATAAHSTVTIDDTSSAHVVSGWAAGVIGLRLVDGPSRVDHKRGESEAGVLLETSHNAYVKPFGLAHHRNIFLTHDGGDVRGEDNIVPANGAASRRFAIRFHLHPAVKLARTEANAVTLTLPSGATWRFTSDAELDLADGVYLGAGDAIRKTQQIVITGQTGSAPTTVKWTLKKAAGIGPETPVN